MRWICVALAAVLVACAADAPAVRTGSSLSPDRPWNEPREQLDKSDIVYGMQQVKPTVGACFDRYKAAGMFSVAVTIVGDGHVASAHVRGPDVPTNDCIRQAAATATFPHFSGAPISIVYPFILR